MYDIVGPVCESADCFAKNYLISAESNDLLAICNAGAYGFSMSSNYNSRPRAAEVLVHDDTMRLIRKRETPQDLLATRQNAMDFKLTEEQQAFRHIAKEFAEHEMAPFAKEWDTQHIFPQDTLRKAAALGLAAICVREDVGGTQLSRLDSAIIFEELATACASTAAYLSIHNMVAWLIDYYGNETLRRKWLPKLITMEIIY